MLKQTKKIIALLLIVTMVCNNSFIAFGDSNMDIETVLLNEKETEMETVTEIKFSANGALESMNKMG